MSCKFRRKCIVYDMGNGFVEILFYGLLYYLVFIGFFKLLKLGLCKYIGKMSL